MPDRVGLPGVAVALVLGSSTGGIGRHVVALAAGLAARGAVVRVCGPEATERQFCFTAAGAEFRPVEIPAGPSPADLRAVRALRALLGGADVVHAHGLRAGLLAGAARRRGGPPLVVTWHNAVLGGPARRRAYQVLERTVARRADLTLGASADLVVRARLLGARDARPGPVDAPALLPPVLPPQQVRAALGADGRALVVAVARLHPQKRLDVLVDAAARWAGEPDVPLVVVAGEGPARAALARRIAATGAPVRLLGHRDDVAELLAAADVVVLSSDWEARALVAQETLRAGRPLVATAVGGVPGLVGDAALLVPPGDPTALAAAVRRVLAEPALAAELGRRGRDRAATWPDGEAAVDLVAAAYAELLARRA